MDYDGALDILNLLDVDEGLTHCVKAVLYLRKGQDHRKFASFCSTLLPF